MASILLIGMNFYDYEDAIVKELRDRGHQVAHFADQGGFFTNHFPFLPDQISERELKRRQRAILQKTEGASFDYVLVIVGRRLLPFFFDELRAANPRARFILYLWDDVKRVQNFDKVKGYYDRILTFDPQDAKTYHFEFLPLFYRRRYDLENAEGQDFQYDVFSVMNCHSDRERIARAVAASLKDRKVRFILTDTGKSMLKRKIKGRKDPQGEQAVEIRFRKNAVPQSELYAAMRRSKAILDVQFPSQRGLTMRTFDTLCVGRKLITTNDTIRHYNFYRPSNILIIDRENPRIPEAFLDGPYEKIDDGIVESYSLGRWIDVLFEGRKIEYLTKNNPFLNEKLQA